MTQPTATAFWLTNDASFANSCSSLIVSCDYQTHGADNMASSSDLEQQSASAEGQFGTPEHCFSTDTIPSQHLALENSSAEWLSSTAFPGHWLFTAAWAHNSNPDTAATEDWTISTASVTEQFMSGAGNAMQGTACSSALPGDCSDPLVCTAQELVAAAAASATPGVHAPRADSAALLNSGTVLLLGQGSTTICGTNTAPVAEVPSAQCAGPHALCEHIVLQDSPSGSVLLPAQQPCPQLQQQPASRTSGSISGTGIRAGQPLRRSARRRQGLLIDSQAGMQLLVDAAVDRLPGGGACALKPGAPAVLQDGGQHQAGQHEQQQRSPAAARQDPLCSAASSHSQLVLSDLQDIPMRPAAADADSHSVPASGEVLVLGVDSSAGVVRAAAAAGVAATSAAGAAARDEAGPHAANAGAAAAPAPAPVLQLLSCSSLNSNAPACRSNSSLFQLNLSNCSFLRLGSGSTQNSSFTSADGSMPQSRQGSFTGQHPGPALLLSPVSAVGVVGVAPASRPTPLPMLHESCSWGNNLNMADRAAAQQQQQGGNARRQTPGTLAPQHKQQEQLYYLLD